MTVVNAGAAATLLEQRPEKNSGSERDSNPRPLRHKLSPGQTDRQVVASGRKLNLRRDLRWVAKRNGKFPCKYSQVPKK